MIPKTNNFLEQRIFYCSVQPQPQPQPQPPPPPPPLSQLARPQYTEHKTSNTQYTHSIIIKEHKYYQNNATLLHSTIFNRHV